MKVLESETGTTFNVKATRRTMVHRPCLPHQVVQQSEDGATEFFKKTNEKKVSLIFLTACCVGAATELSSEQMCMLAVLTEYCVGAFLCRSFHPSSVRVFTTLARKHSASLPLPSPLPLIFLCRRLALRTQVLYVLLEDHSPHISGAAAVYLLAVVQRCRGHPVLAAFLPDVQAAFTRKLTVRCEKERWPNCCCATSHGSASDPFLFLRGPPFRAIRKMETVRYLKMPVQHRGGSRAPLTISRCLAHTETSYRVLIDVLSRGSRQPSLPPSNRALRTDPVESPARYLESPALLRSSSRQSRPSVIPARIR